MACSCHGWVVMLHTPLSWCCTTRQNTKGYCWFYADLDVLPSGNDFFLSCIHYDFSKHFNLSSIKSAFTFFTISSYIVTLQSFGGCWTVSIVYVHFWKEAQKKAHSLNKSSVYFEASADSPHHWTEKVCIISPWYLFVLLCLMDSITPATVFLENLSKFSINLQRKSESHA